MRNSILTLSLLSTSVLCVALASCTCGSLSAFNSSNDTHARGAEPARTGQLATLGAEATNAASLAAGNVFETIPNAAAACGVIAIKNAPATIVLTLGSAGRLVHVTTESSVFGGADTDQCLRSHLSGLFAPDDRERVAVVRYELPQGE
jgi:hypothetical protein